MIQRIGIVCFNTQPHEGGCLPPTGGSGRTGLFQHTAARRRLPAHQKTTLQAMPGFNTQPRGGGCKTFSPGRYPPFLFQHTAARRRLPCVNRYFKGDKLFQHTAARRRLLADKLTDALKDTVSTHSRAEAAAARVLCHFFALILFQHTAARRRLQITDEFHHFYPVFQHTAARRRLHRYRLKLYLN